MITLVTTYKESSKERARNMSCVLREELLSELPVIIGEQVLPGEAKKSFIVREAEKFFQEQKSLNKNLEIVILEEYDRNNMHKAKLLNMCVSKVKTEFVWLVDADIVCNFKLIASRLEKEEFIYHPFKGIVLLNEAETQDFIEKKTITFKAHKRDMVSTKILGPHTFIVRKDMWDKFGGMNEKFIGYGYEDLEFCQRLHSPRIPFLRTSEIGLHLAHPRSRVIPENRKLFVDLLGNNLREMQFAFEAIQLRDKPIRRKNCGERDIINDIMHRAGVTEAEARIYFAELVSSGKLELKQDGSVVEKKNEIIA